MARHNNRPEPPLVNRDWAQQARERLLDQWVHDYPSHADVFSLDDFKLALIPGRDTWTLTARLPTITDIALHRATHQHFDWRGFSLAAPHAGPLILEGPQDSLPERTLVYSIYGFYKHSAATEMHYYPPPHRAGSRRIEL